MTGSGPTSWRHDGSIAGIADLVGNIWEHQDGLKLVGGKIIMPADNDFTMAEKDWPDTGARIDAVNGVQLSDEITERGWCSRYFKDVIAKDGYEVPVALRQALISPSSLARQDHSESLGYMWADNTSRATRIPRRFGDWYNGGHAGVAALFLDYSRGYANAGFGFRLAYISVK